eukprot:2735817-Amphidinium_carterae.1
MFNQLSWRTPALPRVPSNSWPTSAIMKVPKCRCLYPLSDTHREDTLAHPCCSASAMFRRQRMFGLCRADCVSA